MLREDLINLQNEIMGQPDSPFSLPAEAMEQLEVICYEIIHKKYESGFGRQVVGFWVDTRHIPSIYGGLTLEFEKEIVGDMGRWTVYGYRQDITKPHRLWTIASSRTLLLKHKLLHPEDMFAGLVQYEDEDY